MVRIVHARTIDDRPLGFDVVNGRLSRVRVGMAEDAVSPSSHVVPLAEATDLGRLADGTVVDAGGATLVPGAVDAHVHSRDPGLTRKEDWHSLARGAWRGGVVAVADMPNTLPATMTREAVVAKAELARASGIDFRLLLGVGAGNIDKVAGLLSDDALPLCALKVFYGRTTGELMYDDLETLARSLPADGRKLIVFHSEDQCTVDCNHAKLEPRTHARDNAAFAVHSEIRSSAAAHASTRTILDWARTSYKRPIHIAHVSTPLEVELVQEAKAQGVPVTCEVAPHHLLFSTDDYPRLGPLVKMNPPLRSPAEVEELAKLVGQGLVDIFATDHAPHLLDEKRSEVARSPSGVPSVELFWPLVLEIARRTGLPLAQAQRMSTETPARLFGFGGKGALADGFDADFVWLGRGERLVRNEDVVSKCGWTPFDGWRLPRDVLATWTRGRQVYLNPHH